MPIPDILIMETQNKTMKHSQQGKGTENDQCNGDSHYETLFQFSVFPKLSLNKNSSHNKYENLKCIFVNMNVVKIPLGTLQ